MNERDIIHEYDQYYQQAYYALNPIYPRAQLDLRQYLGDQWDEEEKEKLFSEGRNALVFNFIRTNINALIGYQIKHMTSPVVVPIENSDQLGADQATQLLLHAFNFGNGYSSVTQAFGGALKTAINLLTVWVDYRDDPVNGDIRFGREPYCGFIFDPNFTQLDFSDCSYVIRRKYLTEEQVVSLIPSQEKEVRELAAFGWSRDDKFPWLPYQQEIDSKRYMAYNEFFRLRWKTVPVIVNQESGQSMEWDTNRQGMKLLLKQNPQLKLISKQKRYIEQNIILNNHYMRTEINPYGLDEYPFTPAVGIFDPEAEVWSLKLQSLVRCMIDPQKEANKRRSQMIDILDSQINSGWIATKEAVVNPQSLFQTSQGKVIWKKPGAEPNDLVQIQPANIPAGMFELQRQMDQDIMRVLGTNESIFGIAESAQESGLMMMIRQSSSIVNLQDVFANIRDAQKNISRKALKIMQGWKPEKVARIINQQPSPQFFNPNFTKYDISVQEGVLTDTQKQLYFRQLTDLYQLTGGPQSSVVTPDMLAKAAPLQGKSEFNQQIEENFKAQQQRAQQAQQIQQAELTSILNYNKAASVEKMAGAKERYTRAVANMGLEDERASKAIDDRSSAALDRVKAMKELASMDNDEILKYLEIVRALEEMSRQKEEQVKSDDVMISARGEAAANPPAMNIPGQEQVGQMMQEEPQTI